ncbi:MAG: hypothetical protein CMI60_10620 [Parvibaculum sp.]|nr:hypothetical protein [Parvibaculum sp.]|tara:strand:- start:3049 stop:3594 length:546 start_codon:yes stop_codon:yes gene_type:complete
MQAFRMGILRLISVAAFFFLGGSFAIAADGDVFDVSESSIYPVSFETRELGVFTVHIVRTSTGHLEHHNSGASEFAFKMQDRVTYERWFDESWLAEYSDADQSDLDVRKRSFSQGPGIYGVVPYQLSTCVAFLINTGPHQRGSYTRLATTQRFAGTHCAEGEGDKVVEQLIADVDAVRIQR